MIYFIRQAGTNYTKIGFTNRDPNQRLAELQTGSPVLLELIGTMEGDEATEAELHRRYWKFHLTGEWFEIVERINGHSENFGGIAGNTTFDVRQVRGRQFNTVANNGENVPERRAFDRPVNKFLFPAVG